MSKCLFIGSFDPWHKGHEERLINALKIFDEVRIVVADNDKKEYWFTQIERANMIKKCVKKIKGKIKVILAGNKMLHDICHEEKIYNIFRGVKAGRTFEEEIRLQVASKNFAKEEYNEDLLFVYDITTEEDFRGSSIIKLLALKNKKIDNYVPFEIINDIINRVKQKTKKNN